MEVTNNENPAFTEARILNGKVRELLNKRTRLNQTLVWISKFRQQVKAQNGNITDHKLLNDKIYDEIKSYLETKGIEDVVTEIGQIEIKKKEKKEKKVKTVKKE